MKESTTDGRSLEVSNRLSKARQGLHLTPPEADPERKNSEMNSTMVSFKICIIFSFAYLLNNYFLSFRFVHMKSLVFILQFNSYFAPPLPYSILHSYFSFKFYFLFLLWLVSIPYSYYFSPLQSLTTIFLVNDHLLFFFLLLKYPCSLSAFSNLCLMVVD